MTTHLITVGESKAVSIPQKLIEKYQLQDEIELKPINGGIFIGKKRNAREDWNRQIKMAIAAGDKPDNDQFENLSNDWDNIEWTWPE